MRFNYTSDDKQLRQCLTMAVAQGSICWSDVAGAGVFDAERASLAVDALLTEVRHLVTFELTKMLDQTGEARDWNDAIETAIHTIENLE